MAKFSTKELAKNVNKWSSGYYTSGYKSTSKSYGNSSFWMDEDFLQSQGSYDKDSKLNGPRGVDHMKLAAYKRAISNFVRIVTNKDDIRVKYSCGKDSYTDGKTVVISSKLDEKEFDSTVGLALHEGSHIALTDFKTTAQRLHLYGSEMQALADKVGSTNYFVCEELKDIVNVIEDRRIDRFVYDSAPGYQGYYQSVYDKYFNNTIIDTVLLKNAKIDPTYENYFFHICNFANKNRQLDSMPGLRKIWDMIDLPNISRLKNTGEVIDLSKLVYEEIYAQIAKAIFKKQEEEAKQKEKAKKQEEQENPEGNSSPESESNQDEKKEKPEETEEKSEGKGNSDNEETEELQEEDSEESEEDDDEEENLDITSGGSESGSDEEDSEDDSEDEDGSIDVPEAETLTEKEEKALANALQDQKDFLKGDIKKKGLSKADDAKLEAASESSMSLESVGGDVVNTTGNTLNGDKTQCVVVKGLTNKIIDSGLLSEHACKLDASRMKYFERYPETNFVAAGVQLGTLLGKRLKTRDEDRVLKTTRLETGRIDRRLIAELGFGNDRVFAKTLHNTVTPSLIHISIDASGSMSGTKWGTSMKTAIAIAKAASMVASMDCIISLRGSYSLMGTPLMWIVYDSRKDKFNAIKDKFLTLRATGSTPEGLCYEAVMKDILASAQGKEMFFINFCDGEPGFAARSFSYGGEYALYHTKKQVDKMRVNGIKVLAYFISEYTDYNSSKSANNFRMMYGADSTFIDVNNLNQLAKSLNDLFIRK